MMEALLLLTLAGSWQMAGLDTDSLASLDGKTEMPTQLALRPSCSVYRPVKGVGALVVLSPTCCRLSGVSFHAASAADDSSTSQVGTMGRYVPEPAGMLGSRFSVQAVEDAGPSQREEQAVHVLLGANAFFSVGSRLFTQRCLGESTCYERNKLTRELYTNRPKTGIMVQAASTAIENYLLWRIHDNSDKRPWVRAAIVGVLAFNVWNFSNDLRVYKQTGRNR